jgi:hypothetical protein
VERDLEIGERVVGLIGRCFFFSSKPWQRRAGPVRGDTCAPIGPRELGVHDGGRACDLSCARGSFISHAVGGIHGGLCSLLRTRVWCAIILIPLLLAAILRTGAAPPDPLEGPAYRGHCDLM